MALARKNKRNRDLKDKRKKKKFRRKTKKTNIKKIFFFLLLLSFFALIVWVLFFSGVLQIRTVEIKGELDGVQVENVKREVLSFLENRQGKVAPKNNLLLFSGDELAGSLQKKYQTIKKIRFRKIFPDTLTVTVQKRKKIALWQKGGECFLFDEDVNLVERFDCQKQSIKKVCQKEKEKLNVPCFILKLGDLEEDLLARDSYQQRRRIQDAYFKILEALRKTFYYDDSLLAEIPSFLAKEIKIESENNGELIFDLAGDLDWQLKKLRLFFEKKIKPTDLENLDYIDLRIKDRIIYKFKEGAEEGMQEKID